MEDKKQQKFADKLKESGLTIAEFCRLTRTPYSTAQKWYAGSRRTPELALAWLELYKKSLG